MQRFCYKCSTPITPTTHGEGESLCCPQCGSPVDSNRILTSGDTINGFRIEREIGRGGMGIVYLATQLNLDRPVAFKVLSDELAQDKSFVDGFFREARAAASLNHPNIVQAYDAGTTSDEIYYFVMELIDGENLEQKVTRSGKLDLMLALNVAEKISSALEYAWNRQKLCHGDIKPENIILKTNGDIKLADLGLSKSYRDGNKQDQEIMATPLYAAPELIRYQRDKIGFKTDMYSFGATIYHLLAGVPPFPGDDPQVVCNMQLNCQAKPLIAVDRKIPSKISILVDKLMEKDIRKRPDSWTDIHNAFQEIIDSIKAKNIHEESLDEPILSPDLSDSSSTQFFSKKILYIATGFLLLFIFLIGGILLHLVRSKAPESPGIVAAGQSLPSEKLSVAEKWTILNHSLGTLSANAAIEKINQFLIAHEDAPPEAKQTLELLKKRVLNEADLKTFKMELTSLLDHLKKSNFSAENNQDVLQQDINRINGVFMWINSTTQQNASALSNADKKTLQSYLNSARSRIHSIQEAIKQKELEAAKKEADARKAAEARRLSAKRYAEFIERRKLEMKATSLFFKALDPINSEYSYGSMNKSMALLKEWNSKEKANAPAILQKRSDQVLLLFTMASIPMHTIMEDNFNVLKDFELFPEEHPDYRISSINDKEIILSQRDGKVTLSRKIPWVALNNKVMKKLVVRLLRNEKRFARLKPEHQNALLLKLAIPIQDYELVRLAYSQSPTSIESYEDAISFLSQLPLEIAAMKQIDAIFENKAKNNNDTAELVRAFYKNFPHSMVSSLYRRELNQLLGNRR